MKKEIIGSLIGSLVEVKESKNKSLVGLKGEVIDETKYIIKIRDKDKIKTLIKNQVKIQK